MEPRREEQPDTEQAPERREPYEPPRVVWMGRLAELTRGSGGTTFTDDGTPTSRYDSPW